MSDSPFPPQPPKRSLVVDLAASAADRSGARRVASPHLHGGDHLAKLRYEYESAEDFWRVLGPTVGMGMLEGKDVLDVGCGWGGKALRYALEGGVRSMSGFDLPGIYDPDVPRRFTHEHGIENCRFVVGSAESIPFPSESFDVVIMDDVLEHVQDPARAIDECARVLRDGGKLALKFPSIRMLRAHHLDRALAYPGLHYLMSLRRWASGLNHRLLRSEGELTYQPFDEVVESRFGGRLVTRNLNGLDYASFVRIIRQSRFSVEELRIVPAVPSRLRLGKISLAPVYQLFSSLPWLREPLGASIAFVGVLRRPTEP